MSSIRPCCHTWQDFLFLMAGWYSIIYIGHTSFTCPLVDTGSFCILAIVNSVAMNTDRGAYIFGGSVFIFFEYVPRYKIAGSRGSSNFRVFWEAAYYFPQWPHHFTFPQTAHRCPLFLTSSPTLGISSLFGDSPSNRRDMVFHCFMQYLTCLV